MRDGRTIDNRIEIETRALESADRLLSAGPESPNLDRDRLDAVGLHLERGRFGCNLGRIGRRLSGALKSRRPRGGPAKNITLQIREGNNRVIFSCMDADARIRHGLLHLLATFGLGLGISCFGECRVDAGGWYFFISHKITLCLRKNSATREPRLLLATLGAGIATGGLSPDGKFSAMPVPAPGADVLEPLDIKRNLAGQFPLG